MSKQVFIVELNGVATGEEAEEFLGEVFAEVEWGNKYMAISHLTEKGIEKLYKHVLLKEEEEE